MFLTSQTAKNPIVCFEGPSAVGKTTLCNLLSPDYSTIPEVNLLFDRKANEHKTWYLDRQLDRYNLCESSKGISILDGDIFQPVWYNWVCKYPTAFLSKEETHQYYKTTIKNGNITFPDLYIIFTTDDKVLRRRKENDKTRQRRNFQKHLNIIEPLREFWQFIDLETEIELQFINYTTIEQTQLEVRLLLEKIDSKCIDDFSTFMQIEQWLNKK